LEPSSCQGRRGSLSARPATGRRSWQWGFPQVSASADPSGARIGGRCRELAHWPARIEPTARWATMGGAAGLAMERSGSPSVSRGGRSFQRGGWTHRNNLDARQERSAIE